MKKNQGITLIILIITVIILLILTALSIDIVVKNSLFDNAKDVVQNTNDKVKIEEEDVNELLKLYNER